LKAPKHLSIFIEALLIACVSKLKRYIPRRELADGAMLHLATQGHLAINGNSFSRGVFSK
jgi:hypothetical protein